MRIPVAREALKFVLPMVFVTVAVYFIHGVLFLLGGILTLGVLLFFRDPRRAVVVGGNQVISPADGRIVQIRRVEEDHQIWNRVSIFMSPFNVHINYAPIGGEVVDVAYRKGSFLRADAADASSMNESNALLIQGQKMKIRMKQIAGIFARRIVCYSHKGDRLDVGQKIGLIQFGSRVDLDLEPFVDVKVKVGDKVKGCSTILGVVG